MNRRDHFNRFVIGPALVIVLGLVEKTHLGKVALTGRLQLTAVTARRIHVDKGYRSHT